MGAKRVKFAIGLREQVLFHQILFRLNLCVPIATYGLT
jgi:hypothetical protein